MLNSIGVTNIIKKDIQNIQNIQTMFLKDSSGREMFSMINYLESVGYTVRIQVNSDHEVKNVFFIHQDAIKEARRWYEAVTIDATYKTNAHKLSLVNIVGTSNSSSINQSNKLQTFAIAAAFVSSETEETYTWVMEALRESVWPTGFGYKVPAVFITDNERALRNTIDIVFPESNHLLCSWHLWNTMSTKLTIGSVCGDEYRLGITEAEVAFKSIVDCRDEKSFDLAVKKLQNVIQQPNMFKENGRIGLRYLMYV